MSRNINVNPAHYKVAGRERQGEGIIQQEQKQAYTTQQADAMGDGVPPWEATRHSFASAQPEPAPAKKMRKPSAKKRRTSPAKRTAARKATRKVTRAKKTMRAANTPVRRRTAAKSASRARRVKRGIRRR